MLVQFEQNRMVQITRNFELFDKKPFFNYFWQSTDVSVAETIVKC